MPASAIRRFQVDSSGVVAAVSAMLVGIEEMAQPATPNHRAEVVSSRGRGSWRGHIEKLLEWVQSTGWRKA